MTGQRSTGTRPFALPSRNDVIEILAIIMMLSAVVAFVAFAWAQTHPTAPAKPVPINITVTWPTGMPSVAATTPPPKASTAPKSPAKPNG